MRLTFKKWKRFLLSIPIEFSLCDYPSYPKYYPFV